MKKSIFALLALLVALPASAASREVDETRPARRDGEVSIEIIAGSIRVLAWERAEVRVTGTIDAADELDVSADDGDVSIEVEVDDDRHRGSQPADLEIRVPEASSVEIEAISAEIVVEGISGEVSAETVSGTVEIRGKMQEVEAESISGSVRVSSERPLRSGEFETLSGDIDFRGALGKDARLSAESLNGNITLRLPSGTCGKFSVETFNGDIENDFGPPAERTSQWLPAKELHFSAGSCEARVSVEAFNGVVKLVRD